jgi:hypothetical protein
METGLLSAPKLPANLSYPPVSDSRANLPMSKPIKFAVSSVKRSIAERLAPIGESDVPIRRFTTQSAVDVRSMKPSLAARSMPNSVSAAMAEDGWAFEKRCAEILTSSGWEVEITPGSGDFGADLIAKRGITSVAIQCKRWSYPVNNKAVQEAYAGRGHYSSTHAAVVSLSGYTKAAKAQATRLRVRLLTLDDLEHLHIHLQMK